MLPKNATLHVTVLPTAGTAGMAGTTVTQQVPLLPPD